MSKIGEAIKNRRIELNMTQEELGDILGVQKSAIAKYETGVVTNIKRSTIKKLSEVLGLSPVEILGFEDDTSDMFTNPQEAVKFLLEQNVIMGFNGLDITKLSEDEQVEYANEVLNQIRLAAYKYKKD